MATVMGVADWESYATALEAHRQRVAGHFRELIAAPEEEMSGATMTSVPVGRGPE